MPQKYPTPPRNWMPTTKIKCCVCNLVFAMSDIWHERRIRYHRTFFCPDGHAQHCTGVFLQEEGAYEQKPGAYAGKVAG